MASQWYESFFTPLALDFWRAAVPASATAEEADFLVKHLGVAPRARLLDLPAGFGRHALALVRRGYRVTGIDIAPEAIESARREAGELGIEADFLVGDMRSAPPGAPYDGAYCFGNSFGYLSHEDTKSFVRNVFHAIRPGGRWAIDTGCAAESLLPSARTAASRPAGSPTACATPTTPRPAVSSSPACWKRVPSARPRKSATGSIPSQSYAGSSPGRDSASSRRRARSTGGRSSSAIAAFYWLPSEVENPTGSA